MLCSVSAAMGGNKLRLSYRKRKSQLSLVVSLPLSLYSSLKINSLSSLHSSLLSQPLPESWTIAAKDPLTLVKLRVVCQDFHPQVDPLITLAVHSRLTWTLSVLNKHLDPAYSYLLYVQSKLLCLCVRQCLLVGMCKANNYYISSCADCVDKI